LVRSLTKGETLVVASHNEGKVREINELIAPFGFKAVSAGSLRLPEPEETGTTFEENAQIKSVAAAKASGLPALSDDSGIVVDALGGEPGIYSARWGGPDKDFARAMRMIEERLQDGGATEPGERTGRFVAVLSLAMPDGSSEEFRGEVEGTLVWPPRGENGFGYDPVFLPVGFDRTFGEMSAVEKHGWDGKGEGLSHRARAFARFARAKLGAS
jgi:XTP/dITP diphosphohydrolase